MEKTKNNRKRKIFVALCSMVLCFTLIGVAVYAALVQTASVSNVIRVSSAGQAECALDIYAGSTTVVAGNAEAGFTKAKNPLTTSTVGNGTNLAWDTNKTLEKGATLDNLEVVTDENNWDFDYVSSKNAYGYKLVFTNSAAGNVKIDINLKSGATTNPYTPNEQVVLYYAIGDDGNYTALAADAVIPTQNLNASDDLNIYVVAVTTVPLEELVNEEGDGNPFTMNVIITSAAV